MRALLVLYMIEGLHLTEVQSFGVYAVYTALVEMCVLMGGFLADKVFGLRRCIFFGGLLITAGHLCLAFTEDFFLGLAFIIAGSSLFKSNVKALLGSFYEEDDPRREAGFTLFYSGMNLGGLLAAVGCGFAAHYFGWHVGFGLAALGMVAGLIIFVVKREVLENKGLMATPKPLWMQSLAFILVVSMVPLFAMLLQQDDLTKTLLPAIGILALVYLFTQTRERAVIRLLGLIFLVMVYFAFEELMGSLLMVFSNKYVVKTVPAAVLTVMNPLVIIVLGPLLAKFQSRWKLIYAFGCLTFAFFSLYLSPNLLLLSFALIALGELFIAPIVYAESTKAPLEVRGVMTSLVTMGFAYGSLFSGTLSQIAQPQTLTEYQSFFLYATLAALVFAIVLVLLRSRTKMVA
jgi:proton-dependent oligopeptide transporter, POT family